MKIMKNKMIDIYWRLKKTYWQGYFHIMMTVRVVNKFATSSCGLYYIILNKSENATPELIAIYLHKETNQEIK